MAAAYQTGISSSPTNLLQTLVSFLATQGWTTDSSVSDGTGWRAHLHKGSLYVNLRAAMDELIWPENGTYHDALFASTGGYGIGLYLGDGYSGGAAWHAQSGRPVRPTDGSTAGCGANLPAGSVAAFHIFDDGADHIIVVVERAPGIFCFFGWGPALEAAGQPEAFPYFFGSSGAVLNTYGGELTFSRGGIDITAWPPMSHADKEVSSYGTSIEYVHATAYVRVDAATFSARWVGNCAVGTGPEGYGYTGRRMVCSCNIGPGDGGMNDDEYPSYEDMIDRIHQTAFVGSMLLPLHSFVLTDPDARWAPLGYPPSIFWCEAVGHGYGAGSVYQVGGLDYMVFPHFAVRKGA